MMRGMRFTLAHAGTLDDKAFTNVVGVHVCVDRMFEIAQNFKAVPAVLRLERLKRLR